MSKNTGQITGIVVPDVYYSLYRISDNYNIIPYGLAPDHHTLTSYDENGSYFDLDMSMLEPDFSYGIKLMFVIGGKREEQTEIFKFRVEKKKDNLPDV